MDFLVPAPKVHPLGDNTCEVTWEPLQPMKSDSIVYILQLASGREVDQVKDQAKKFFVKFFPPPSFNHCCITAHIIANVISF